MSDTYRVWLDNGDVYIDPRPVDEAAETVVQEMGLGAHVVLVTHGALDREQTLQALSYIRGMIEKILR